LIWAQRDARLTTSVPDIRELFWYSIISSGRSAAANDTHIADQDIPELRQFVDVTAAKDIATW